MPPQPWCQGLDIVVVDVDRAHRRRAGEDAQMFALGGEIAFMGLFSQADEPSDFLSVMSKTVSIRGTAVGSAAAFADLVEAIDANQVKPPIGRTFAFEDVKDAYRAQASPELFGKVVIELVAP